MFLRFLTIIAGLGAAAYAAQLDLDDVPAPAISGVIDSARTTPANTLPPAKAAPAEAALPSATPPNNTPPANAGPPRISRTLHESPLAAQAQTQRAPGVAVSTAPGRLPAPLAPLTRRAREAADAHQPVASGAVRVATVERTAAAIVASGGIRQPSESEAAGVMARFTLDELQPSPRETQMVRDTGSDGRRMQRDPPIVTARTKSAAEPATRASASPQVARSVMPLPERLPSEDDVEVVDDDAPILDDNDLEEARRVAALPVTIPVVQNRTLKAAGAKPNSATLAKQPAPPVRAEAVRGRDDETASSRSLRPGLPTPRPRNVQMQGPAIAIAAIPQRNPAESQQQGRRTTLETAALVATPTRAQSKLAARDAELDTPARKPRGERTRRRPKPSRERAARRAAAAKARAAARRAKSAARQAARAAARKKARQEQNERKARRRARVIRLSEQREAKRARERAARAAEAARDAKARRAAAARTAARNAKRAAQSKAQREARAAARNARERQSRAREARTRQARTRKVTRRTAPRRRQSASAKRRQPATKTRRRSARQKRLARRAWVRKLYHGGERG